MMKLNKGITLDPFDQFYTGRRDGRHLWWLLAFKTLWKSESFTFKSCPESDKVVLKPLILRLDNTALIFLHKIKTTTGHLFTVSVFYTTKIFYSFQALQYNIICMMWMIVARYDCQVCIQLLLQTLLQWPILPQIYLLLDNTLTLSDAQYLFT